MFQRVGAIAYKRDLYNTVALCKVFDNPQTKFKSVHVTGTNGKGSSSHMLASILQSAGYKTGLYTSPHLKEFTERIKINGQEVDQEFIIDFVNKVKPHIDLIKPSFFEITVVMAFEYFARQKVDVAIIEVGVGGRLDSTNVIIPEVSLITNIGFDHVALLGDTLQKIAFEKAGIIKSGVPVVISQKQPEVESVFREVAMDKKSPIHYAIEEYSSKGKSSNQLVQILKDSVPFIDDIQFPLKGTYQMKNLPGVMKSIDLLKEMGFSISNDSVKHGLENVLVQTGLKGRWQQLGDKPLILCDTGHNADGVQEVVNQIGTYSFEKLFIVWGMVNDKSRDEILNKLPSSAVYFFCQAKIPRALDAHELANDAAKFGLQGEVIVDVNEAITKAKSLAGHNDFIFVGGSTFVVAEIENL